MPNLNLQFAHQAYEHSCWATCGRLVKNAYQGQTRYASDDDFAESIDLKAQYIQNMRVILVRSGQFNGIDGAHNLPPFARIKQEIDMGRPIIVSTSDQAVSPGGPSESAQYVLIVGYEESNGQSIIVLDPASQAGNEGPRQIAYDPTRYEAAYGNLYWGVPYYTKPSA